jgi:hypothetical protein
MTARPTTTAMHTSRILHCAMPALIALALTMPAAAQSGGEVLTNESIVSMTAAKLNRDLLLGKVNTTRNTYDVSIQGLIGLHSNKVHQEVIKAMIGVADDPKLGARPARNPEVLDNQSVIAMVSAKLPKAVTLAKIQNTRAAFDTTSAGLVQLTQAKVPSDVIKAMMAKPAAK